MNAPTVTNEWVVAQPRGWWRSRWFVVLAAFCSVLPLLWPAMPPLVDLPGHIGRYRILVEAGQAPLSRHWAVHWSLIGNLGVDLLVIALHPLLDVEPAARLVVTAIPLLTVGAMLWLAREAHGRLPAGAAFAFPLAYAFPFQLGFVNFCLSQAFALGALALWLRLARRWSPFARAALFAPIACAIWVAHSFGWAMLGIWVWGAEWAIQRDAGRYAVAAAWRAGLMCLPMALPALAPLIGSDPPRGDTGDWFNWFAKAHWIASIVRERWQAWDAAAVAFLLCVLWTAFRSRRMGFAPVLGIPAVLSIIAFVLMPRLFEGGAYVDMRMAPAALALALLAIRVPSSEDEVERRTAMLATGFMLARTFGTTLAFALYAHGQAMAVRAIPALPSGGAVLVLVNEPSSSKWSQPRLTHIAGIAVARARVFENEQWALPGQQPIRPLHPAAAPLDRDPSHLVYPRGGEFKTTDFDDAIRNFDRCTFDAVWTIGFPAGRAAAADLKAVWSDGRSAVYLVSRPRAACP